MVSEGQARVITAEMEPEEQRRGGFTGDGTAEQTSSFENPHEAMLSDYISNKDLL